MKNNGGQTQIGPGEATDKFGAELNIIPLKITFNIYMGRRFFEDGTYMFRFFIFSQKRDCF